MPRYLVRRTFIDGLRIPCTEEGSIACLHVTSKIARLGVTWIRSYVSEDKSTTFCVYDAPNPEAIRLAAERTGLPIESITSVSALSPYFYY